MKTSDSEETKQEAGKTVDLPQPTYAPAAMALGVMMLLWGIVTMWPMSLAGVGLMTWSLWTWMQELRKA
ncbi:MAG: hypothetical protein KDA52_12900 [Planctomycetaceae bacterium]|nr:hypothetical protein [Planctomycetaceae bacterium]